MNPLIWVIIFIFNMVGAWINYLNNIKIGWFWWACLISMVPMFPIISRFSKNLLLDGIIYDVVIFFSYLVTLIFLGCAKTVTLVQWIGVVLTIIGCLLMKVKI